MYFSVILLNLKYELQFVRVHPVEFNDLCEGKVSTVALYLRGVQYNLCYDNFYDVTMSRDDVIQIVVDTTSPSNHGAHFTIHFTAGMCPISIK